MLKGGVSIQPPQTPLAYALAHANTPIALSRFKNFIFRHYWHCAVQKNSHSIETEQRYLCRILHFNRQNLMLISPPND